MADKIVKSYEIFNAYFVIFITFKIVIKCGAW
jgi:hypothetical protein